MDVKVAFVVESAPEDPGIKHLPRVAGQIKSQLGLDAAAPMAKSAAGHAEDAEGHTQQGWHFLEFVLCRNNY